MIKAVIFDLDGTITEPFLDFDLIRREMGLAEDSGPILEQMARMDPERRRQAEQVLARHEQEALARCRLNDGALETVKHLRRTGRKVAILTRNVRCNVECIADRFGLVFDAVVDRQDGPAKPDAFGVLKICEQFAVRPHEAIVVGDYVHDLQCARAAGATAVLLKTHKQAEKFALEADFAINRLDEVLGIIEDIGRNLRRTVK